MHQISWTRTFVMACVRGVSQNQGNFFLNFTFLMAQEVSYLLLFSQQIYKWYVSSTSLNTWIYYCKLC